MVLYSNRAAAQRRLVEVRTKAQELRRSPVSRTRRRLARLTSEQEADLVDQCQAGALIKELASQFGLHRVTVTEVLKRQGAAFRQVGLTSAQITEAIHLYTAGWSLSRLAQRYGVDGMTVRRYLRLAGVAMRSPHERPNLR